VHRLLWLVVTFTSCYTRDGTGRGTLSLKAASERGGVLLVQCVWEHNGNDSLIFAVSFVGAFTRGARKEEALAKLPKEIASYLAWKTGAYAPIQIETEIIQEQASSLQIADADSDVLFESEKASLSLKEYCELKRLALKSASDFQTLFDAVPRKDLSILPKRKTFYGEVPITAQQMYDHTKGVNSYYFGEIGIAADHTGTILECRERAFQKLELLPNFPNNQVWDGSYGEQWTLRKVFRRFIWHDRIHAKALYRMAVKTFDAAILPDVFFFEILK
jgi:hypothetical protein